MATSASSGTPMPLARSAIVSAVAYMSASMLVPTVKSSFCSERAASSMTIQTTGPSAFAVCPAQSWAKKNGGLPPTHAGPSSGTSSFMKRSPSAFTKTQLAGSGSAVPGTP